MYCPKCGKPIEIKPIGTGFSQPGISPEHLKGYSEPSCECIDIIYIDVQMRAA